MHPYPTDTITPGSLYWSVDRVMDLEMHHAGGVPEQDHIYARPPT